MQCNAGVAETKRRGGGVGDGSKAKEESDSSDGGGEGAETGQIVSGPHQTIKTLHEEMCRDLVENQKGLS